MDNIRKIFKSTPIVKTQYQKYLSDFQLYQIENQREVKYMYRWFLKNIPTYYHRKLEKYAKIEEVKYLFRQSKNEQYISTIEESKELGYYVIDKLEQGEWPPLPNLGTNFIYSPYSDQESQMRKSPMEI